LSLSFFPYTPLFRSLPDVHVSFEAGDVVSQVLNFGAPTPIDVGVSGANLGEVRAHAEKIAAELAKSPALRDVQIPQALDYPTLKDRKSTRLNSSHVA